MSLTFVLWMKALQFSPNSAAVSNLAYLSPFLSLVFIHAILGEKILASSVLGLAFIVAGILVQARWGASRGP
jgi:drug/metabolite transporter (DMT)-like permease